MTGPTVANEDLPIRVRLPLRASRTTATTLLASSEPATASHRAPAGVRLERRELLTALNARLDLLNLAQRFACTPAGLICPLSAKRSHVGRAVNLVAATRNENDSANRALTRGRTWIANREPPPSLRPIAGPL